MRRQRDMMGGFRLWRSLLGVSALVLLSGCGWFGGGNQLDSQKARPGADRNVAGSGALPSANPGRQYEPGFVATDETRTPRVGSIVAGKGGQKAQKEAIEKEAAERDAKDREAREKREAADREAKAKEKETEKVAPSAARCVPPRTSRTAGRGRARQCQLEQDHACGGTRRGTGANGARDSPPWRRHP